MMSLVADYSTSSSSESAESDSEDIECAKTKEKNVTSYGNAESKLPSANLLLAMGASTGKKVGEVLNNPYLNAELLKNSLLEKHVKMVNKDEHLVEKNGRKICWNNRKGRCRFGSNCLYAHDSDLVTGITTKNENINKNNKGPTKRSAEAASTSTAFVPTIEMEAEETTGHTNKRRRPGLTNTIHPGNRVMKSYMHQQQARKS